MGKLKELAVLAELNRDIQGATTIGQLLKILVEKAVIGVNFERGLIYLLEGEYLRCVAVLDRVNRDAAQLQDKKVGFRLSEQSLETLAVAQGMALHSADTGSDPRIGEKYRRHMDSREYCVVPLKGRRGVLGVFTGDKFYSGEPITGEDIETLGHFADHVSIAIENALLHEEAKRFHRLLERRVAERTAELHEANERISGKARQLDTLYSVANMLNRSLDGPEVLAQVLSLLEGLGYGKAAVHSAGRSFDPLAVSRELGPNYPFCLGEDAVLRLQFEGSASPLPVALPTGSIFRAELPDELSGISTILRAPMRGLEDEVAVLFVYLANGESLPAETSGFFAAFAKQAGVALERGRAAEKLRKERDEAATASRALERENTYMKDRLAKGFSVASIIGAKGGLKSTMEMISRVAPTNATVALFGETGTGKELLAKAIHSLSRRSERPLVTINCAAIPEELLESELFGHEKGSFTGAHKSRQGLFEIADGSTIFLDEIGEISQRTQAKLLRALQEQEVRRVGGQTPVKVDVRVIVATNRRENDPVFRADFLHRITVFPIEVPPLRERADDIPELVSHFASRFSKELGRGFTVDENLLAGLKGYSWPGNVRELENYVERLAILGAGDGVPALKERVALAAEQEDAELGNLSEAVREFKRRRLSAALERFSGNGARAAQALGLPRSNFSRMCKALGLRQ